MTSSMEWCVPSLGRGVSGGTILAQDLSYSNMIMLRTQVHRSESILQKQLIVV